MRVVFSLVSFVFALISIFSGVAKFYDVKSNTTYQIVPKVMTVKEKTNPKRFSVIMHDADGKEYHYEKSWCNNHNDYFVGSKHTINVKVETYIKNKAGYKEKEVTEFFEVDCK